MRFAVEELSPLALAALFLLGAAMATPTGAATPPFAQEIEDAGIRLGFELDRASRVEGQTGDESGEQTVRLSLSLRDAASGLPLAGAEPAAWMSRGLHRDVACGDRITRYLTGDLFSRAEVDFNVYYILSLNHDATLSVVDPLFGFGGSRVLTELVLASPGADWVLFEGPGRGVGRIFVSQPEAGKVAIIRTDLWRLERQVEVGPGVARLRLQDDGALLWALHDEGIAILDPRRGEVVDEIHLDDESGQRGDGQDDSSPGDFVFGDRGRHAWIIHPERSQVLALDVRTRRKLGGVETGRFPVAIDWSSKAEAAWISHSGGTLAAVDISPQGRPRLRTRLETGAPLGRIRFAPDGRLGFAVSPEANLLSILDVARGRVVKSGPMAGGPVDVSFSGELAYIRDRSSEHVLMVPLESAGEEGEPIQAADFPGGQLPLGHRKEDPRVLAQSFDRAPGASAMVLANANDRAIYFYMEGMAAPMGHFTLNGRRPLAVKVVDRSLREKVPGIYETFARHEGPGLYEVAVFLDAPRLMRCFEVEIEATDGPSPKPARIRLAADGARPLPGGGVEIEVETQNLAQDLILHASRVAGDWHRRILARPVAEGRFRARIFPGPPGRYLIWAESGTALQGRPPILSLQVPASPERTVSSSVKISPQGISP